MKSLSVTIQNEAENFCLIDGLNGACFETNSPKHNLRILTSFEIS